MVSAHHVLGIIGNVISFLLFLSPVPTFLEIKNTGTVGNYSEIPYLARFLNCGIWALYGFPEVHPDSLMILTINGTGFVFEIAYLVLFYIYSAGGQKTRVGVIAIGELVLLLLIGVTLTRLDTIEVRSEIVGIIGIAANIFMYASPFSNVVEVIRTLNVESMPFLPSLIAFLSSIIWSIYAFFPYDLYIAIANGTGFVLGAAQLMIYATIKLINWFKEAQMGRDNV